MQPVEKTKLFYFYDPLCGWCYGFGPVIAQLQEIYAGIIDTEIVSGGMIRGENIPPIGQTADYILKAIPQVERYTGIRFGEAYIRLLKEGTLVVSSEKPSLALETFKSLRNAPHLTFAHDFQKAWFGEGKNPNEDQTYLDLAKKYDLNPEEFAERLHSFDTLQATQQGFEFAAKLGITGFPALVAFRDRQYYLLSQGYQDFAPLNTLLHRFLQ